MSDLAGELGVDPLEYTLDLLIEDRGASTMVVFHMDEVDMRAALSWQWSGVGSDQLGVTGPAARVHPRAYGTFARVLGWAVREAGLFPLETAVYKMTGLPAGILGLRDRGLIRVGGVADVVVFDPLLWRTGDVRGADAARAGRRARAHGRRVRGGGWQASAPGPGQGAARPLALSRLGPGVDTPSSESSCSI